MTTKHVPATPLPWIVNQRKHVCAASTGFADVATTADGRKTQTAVDDAAYIAHTANADADAAAADAAAHAADAAAHARRETLKQCADIVRKHFPRPPRSYVRVIT